MKKRLFTSVFSLLLLIVISIFGITGCAVQDDKKISLDKTAKELIVGESFTLTATTTPADAEVVWSSSDETIVTVDNGNVLAISVGTATVTAKNDTATATCEITVKAANEQTYTVVFKNGDTELKSVKAAEGSTVSYTGVIPSKTATEQYSYIFSGWSLSMGGEAVDISTILVDGDKTFYAIFTETVREYTVTWDIGSEKTEDTVAYGTVPEYKGTTPTKPMSGNTRYTFIGWASSLSGEALETLPAVTGDVTYYAVFEEVTAQTKFTVTWKNGNVVLKTDSDVEFQTLPVYTGEVPTKEMTSAVEYVFAGWATSANGEKLDVLPEVTTDVTYYAVFEETARKYTITWVIEGVESTSQVAYGSEPKYDGTPVKADSVECSYKFVGWALSADGEAIETLPAVNSEVTYYAVFAVDTVFETPKFTEGNIMYSANSQEAFLPEGLLGEGVTLVKAVWEKTSSDRVTVYENGVWSHDLIALTEEELNGNLIGERALEVELSDTSKYRVDMQVYAGVIDELADFPLFFNNEATAEGYAPVTYGYYIVTKDLGTGSEELAFTQCATTDFKATCGFNGVLNGQGHTLRFKLTSGALVGMVLGNAVIENLGVIFEDATSTHYGVFGYITSGAPEIRNCYIEQTNNHYAKTTNFGVMGRPSGKLRLHNTVVYGFNIGMDNTLGATTLNETSSNAYVIHARSGATGLTIATNYTKVINDGVENGSRELALSEIEDASTFNDAYWNKENGKLVWKGLEIVTITWLKGEEATVKTFTKGSYLQAEALPNGTKTETEVVSYYWSTSENGEKVSFTLQSKADADTTYYFVEKKSVRYYTVTWVIDGVETTTNYEYNATAAHDAPVKEADENYSYEFKGWSLNEDGELVELGAVKADGIVYYAVFEKTAIASAITIAEPILYSCGDSQLFLPQEVTFTLDETMTITSADEATVYYQNGAWVNTFALTEEQMKANAIGSYNIKIVKGTDTYLATVKSYAGIIDELSDFPKFFNNDTNAVAPNVYGYYIVTKNLGTGSEELALTQTTQTDYSATNGFNGVLDGQGYTLKFKLTSGGLVGMILGNAVIKNLSVIFEDATSTHYGVFGYMTNGAPEIRNCYIQQTNNHYARTTLWGIMARPNGKLRLHNTVVFGSNITFDSTWSTPQMNGNSSNAFIIWARANATSFGIAANFAEVSTSGALTSDLSVLDSNYWNTTDNQPSWKQKADMVFSSVIKVSA